MVKYSWHIGPFSSCAFWGIAHVKLNRSHMSPYILTPFHFWAEEISWTSINLEDYMKKFVIDVLCLIVKYSDLEVIYLPTWTMDLIRIREWVPEDFDLHLILHGENYNNNKYYSQEWVRRKVVIKLSMNPNPNNIINSYITKKYLCIEMQFWSCVLK